MVYHGLPKDSLKYFSGVIGESHWSVVLGSASVSSFESRSNHALVDSVLALTSV